MPVKSTVLSKTLRRPGTSAPPNVGVGKVFLRDLPAHQFLGRTRAVIAACLLSWSYLRLLFPQWSTGARISDVESMRAGAGFLGVEAIDDAVLHFVRIGQNVAVVEADDLAEIVDAGLIAVDGEGLNRMLEHPAERLMVEDSGEGGRPHLHRCIDDIAIDGIADSHAESLRRTGLEPLACTRFRGRRPRGGVSSRPGIWAMQCKD